MSTEKEPGAIQPPDSDKAREVGRTLVETAVELIPGLGPAVVKAARVSHPSQMQKDEEAWQRKISERTNENTEKIIEHDRILNPTETVGAVTELLVIKLAHDCPDGMGRKLYQLDALQLLLPDIDRRSLEDAVYELEALNLIKLHRRIGGSWHMELMQSFYEQVDCQVMNYSTNDDAVEIAKILADAESGSIKEIHTKIGWDKRRFNPALGVLLRLFPSGSVSRTIDRSYPTSFVALSPQNRAALRRFVAKHRG